ncbi:MAG: Omp28-related outer membrane protein [Flavobacteriales bacterium]|nr:Omp28-related outer membrane protein [Flavobacteriales bacterium]
MKHLYLSFLLLPSWVSAQSLISYLPQQRTALLEDFTGVNCGYCPEGHAIADDLEMAHPEEVVVLGIHAGIYANPSAGQPDFRTAWGTAVDAFFPITGYPAGVVGRHTFPAGLVQGRGGWTDMVEQLLTFDSPVNLGMRSTFDPNTRDLTVEVEWHYTADSPGGSDYVTVLLKEDHIIGWQTDYGNGNNPNYDHTNVFRACFTQTWGDEVTNTTAGSSETRTFTYNVPLDFDIANCEVVAFLGEYQSDVYQSREVAADGGETLVISDMVPSADVYAQSVQQAPAGSAFSVINYSGVDQDFEITLSSMDAPADWSSEFTILGNTYAGSATLTLADNDLQTLSAVAIPGPTAGVATYTVTVAAVNDPNAPVLSEEFHVISGVSDLIVTNPEAEPHEPIYVDALVAAGQAGRGKTTRNHFIGFGEHNALDGVLNLYCNVSWTFPALTDPMVAVLQDHLDNGGNLMIAGQDIGWDQSGAASSNGTPITEAFYEDYMHATYVADGSTANSSVDFLDNDAVFGTVPNSGINSVFGSNSYPEEISPIAPAEAIFNYNGNANKIGGLRVQTSNYKLVYFGVGPEQMSDVGVAGQMIELSHDWFYGLVSVEELDAAFMGSAFPVPANDHLTIRFFDARSEGAIEVHDALGRVVMQDRVNGSDFVVLDVTGLAPGSYSYRMVVDASASPARSFVIVR